MRWLLRSVGSGEGSSACNAGASASHAQNAPSVPNSATQLRRGKSDGMSDTYASCCGGGVQRSKK